MSDKNKILFKTKKLYVMKSQLPEAGLGLYTYFQIKKGESLGGYKGKLLTLEECKQEKYLPLWGHMLDLSNIEKIYPYVAIHPSKNMVLRYINHAPDTVDGKKVKGKWAVNVFFSEIEEFPYIEIVAKRDIDANSEIFLNYGPGFSNLFLKNQKLRNFYLSKM